MIYRNYSYLGIIGSKINVILSSNGCYFKINYYLIKNIIYDENKNNDYMKF